MSTLYYLTLVLVGIGALASWGFVALYHHTATWWKTFVGRHFMAYSVAIALLYARSVWSLLQGKGTNPDLVTFSLTCFITFVVVWRVVVYVRLERMKGKK